MASSPWHHKPRPSHKLSVLSLRCLRNLLHKRRKPSQKSKVAEEKPKTATYYYVPKHAASSHLVTTSPMTAQQRSLLVPESLPSANGSQFQPTKTLAEQSEEMRARGRQRGEIVVGGMSETSEVSAVMVEEGGPPQLSLQW